MSFCPSIFTQNPGNEVPDVATATLAGDALDALTAAKTAVTVQRGVVRTLVAARRVKETVLRNRIRGVIEELNRVLGPLDGRWDAFGLNQPGIKQVPPTPGKVTIVLMGDGKAAVKWEPTPRAEYYRVWLKVDGTHDNPLPVGTPADTDFTIEDVTEGAKFEVSLSAVNNGGESARSEAVTETME